MLNIEWIFNSLQGFPCLWLNAAPRFYENLIFFMPLNVFGTMKFGSLKVFRWCHCLKAFFSFFKHKKSVFFSTGTLESAIEVALKDMVFLNPYEICHVKVWPHRNKNTQLSLCQCHNIDCNSCISKTPLSFVLKSQQWNLFSYCCL